MSFNRLSSLEAGTGGGYSDDPDFQQHLHDLKDKLQSLLSNNRKLSNDVGVLGSKKDTPRLRERVHITMEKSRDTCKSIGDGIKHLQKWENLSKQHKYEQTKISSDFQTALQEFQNLQRAALEKERASISAAREAHAADQHRAESGDHHQQQQQQQQDQQQELLAQETLQLAPQDEVDFQETLIIEREEEIRNIEQGVGDLNVLFRQVAQIVNEQGAQLITISDNVENVRDDTRGADLETRQAARYQKAARNKRCFLLLIMAVILLILVLAVVS